MTETKREINGVVFQVAPFMAVEALRLKAYLIRTFGAALAETLGGMNLSKAGGLAKEGGTGGIGEVNLASLASGIEKLTEQLSEDSFISLLKRLFANVIATWSEGGKSRSAAFCADFETAMHQVFTGRLFTVYPVIGLVLEANYPDFFGKAAAALRGIGRKIPKIPGLETDAGTPPKESGQSGMSEN